MQGAHRDWTGCQLKDATIVTVTEDRRPRLEASHFHRGQNSYLHSRRGNVRNPHTTAKNSGKKCAGKGRGTSETSREAGLGASGRAHRGQGRSQEKEPRTRAWWDKAATVPTATGHRQGGQGDQGRADGGLRRGRGAEDRIHICRGQWAFQRERSWVHTRGAAAAQPAGSAT